jgi:uncharacterized lipoprotein YajG
MKRMIIIAALMLGGCATRPTCVEYYPPTTPEEQAAGHGAVKMLDYRKPASAVSVFGFSIF